VNIRWINISISYMRNKWDVKKYHLTKFSKRKNAKITWNYCCIFASSYWFESVNMKTEHTCCWWMNSSLANDTSLRYMKWINGYSDAKFMEIVLYYTVSELYKLIKLGWLVGEEKHKNWMIGTRFTTRNRNEIVWQSMLNFLFESTCDGRW